MYDIERQEKILAILKEKKTISVNKLTSMLYASGATVRRDLVKMEQKGLIIRTFGAVMINANPSNKETSFELRENTNISEKRLLCAKACEYIKDNSTIFLDSSSTLIHITPFLNDFNHLTIITNGLNMANEVITKTKHQVIIPGGSITPNTNSILGPLAFSTLGRFHCNMSIMSSSALNFKEQILCESTVDQAEIKHIMVKNSDVSFCLIDSSKFNKTALYQTTELKNIDYIISNNNSLTETEAKVLRDNDIIYIPVDK
ncbi:MAG: DeoR/GlpR family DNA-binding transcription regulator [Bacilli bacterium]